MELTLRARASLKRKGLLSSSRINVEDVVRALIAGAKGTPLETNARARALQRSGTFRVNMHPNVGPVEIRANGDDVQVEAKAYSAGPGYHAFLVSVLDSMQTSLGLQWEWDDPTDYALKRDFAALQSRMAASFAANCASLVSGIEADGGAFRAHLFMPVSFGVIIAEQDEILTPLGPVSLEQVRHWAFSIGAELREAAAAFYMWWDQGFGGSFYRGIVLYWLWMDIRWATPLDREEADFIFGTLDCYSTALEQGADLPIPEAAITELFALVEGKLARPIADPRGIGYRRRVWTRSIGQNWRLVMPGCLEPSEEGEDDAPTYVFTADSLDVRASVYIAPSDDPEIRAGVFDREISVIDRFIEKYDRTVTVRNLARTHALGERTSVCILTITSSTPGTRLLGERIGKSLTYVS
jgi:hypothetical protein